MSNTPCGASLCTIGPANARPSTCIDATKVSTNNELLVADLKNTPVHWLVNSSVIAVPNMQMIMNQNRGISSALYISPVLTPEATRSVGGKSSLENR